MKEDHLLQAPSCYTLLVDEGGDQCSKFPITDLLSVNSSGFGNGVRPFETVVD